MIVKDLPLADLKLIVPRVFGDDRGFFFESFSQERYQKAGIDCTFVQDNHSRSVQHVVRGLHYQSQPGQAKLVRVSRGRIFDVAVDLRAASATFGQWYGVELDDVQHMQLFIPVGFAHGFCVLSNVADVAYKASAVYDPATECGIQFDDPSISVVWPTESPIVSGRDQKNQSFESFRSKTSI